MLSTRRDREPLGVPGRYWIGFTELEQLSVGSTTPRAGALGEQRGEGERRMSIYACCFLTLDAL